MNKNIDSDSLQDYYLDSGLPANPKKSHFKIVLSEEKFFVERGYFIELYYDQLIIPSWTAKWSCKEEDKILFKYYNEDKCILCLDSGNVTIYAEYGKFSIKKKIRIKPVQKNNPFKIAFSENADVSEGRYSCVYSEFEDSDVTMNCTWSSWKSDYSDFRVNISRFDGDYRVLFLKEGIEYLACKYDDKIYLKILEIQPAKDYFYIKAPDDIVYKSGRTVRFRAIYNGLDVTETADWAVQYIKQPEDEIVASYTDVKGETVFKNPGKVIILVDYNGERVFSFFDITK